MCLVADCALKLGVSKKDVFRLAKEAWPVDVSVEDGIAIWFREDHVVGWAAEFCFKTLGIPPEPSRYRQPIQTVRHMTG